MDVIRWKAKETTGIKIVRNIEMSADGKALLIALGTLYIQPDGKLDAHPRGGIMVEIPGADHGGVTTGRRIP